LGCVAARTHLRPLAPRRRPSTWFPIYDRNPQTYVDNIFFAKPADYKKATIKIFDGGQTASFVDLPVVEGAGLR